MGRSISLDKGDNGFLCREDFHRIPELAINPLGDRIVNAFFCESGSEDQLNFRQFMKAKTNQIRPQIRWCPSGEMN